MGNMFYVCVTAQAHREESESSSSDSDGRGPEHLIVLLALRNMLCVYLSTKAHRGEVIDISLSD